MPMILSVGAAFSEVIRKRSIISRCKDIFDHHDIDYDGDKISILPSVERKLQSRGVSNTSDIISDYENLLSTKWSTSPFKEQAYLHAHGHIGDSLIWAIVGRIALHNNVSENICREIANGRRDERRRVWHRWLAGQTEEFMYPLSFALN